MPYSIRSRGNAVRRSRWGNPLADIRVDVEGIPALVAALKAEADGKVLRRQLAKDMRTSLKPAVGEARASIMGMSSAGHSVSPTLRSAISRRISANVRLTGRSTGARVRARKLPDTVRGFRNAPKLTNRKGWRHPLFGDTEEWVEQEGKPNWFDDVMRKGHDKHKRAVLGAMEDMARRISRRSKG